MKTPDFRAGSFAGKTGCGPAAYPVGFLNAGIVGALLAGAVRLMSRFGRKRSEQGK